jgi:hypothetical protein
MPQIAVLDSKKKTVRLHDVWIPGWIIAVGLLHRHKGADRNFGEKFASSILRQSDAAV